MALHKHRPPPPSPIQINIILNRKDDKISIHNCVHKCFGFLILILLCKYLQNLCIALVLNFKLDYHHQTNECSIGC